MITTSTEEAFNVARRRVLAGERLTLQEQQHLVDLLRNGRNAAAEAGGKARTTGKARTAAKQGISDEDLDAQLGDLGL